MSFYFLYALLLFLILPFIYLKNPLKIRALFFSDINLLKDNANSKKLEFVNLIFKILRTCVIILFILALARPRTAKQNVWEETEGIDIMLVIDISSSMLAEDFMINNTPYNRLQVVKAVISDFIKKREHDRIGITVFSGETMTLCPLTTDYGVLNEFLETAKIGMLEDGTAIGDAVAFSVNRLLNAKGKSKVMILLTDGSNNLGELHPLLSADIAKAKGVKIYTIGAGKKGKVPFPQDDPFFGKRYVYVEMPIDEELLKDIAKKTNGKFYRATNTETLKSIYEEIDSLEKTKVETSKSVEYTEKFKLFLIPGMLLLLIEIILRNTIFMRVP